MSALLAVVAAAVLFGTTGTAQELGPDDASPLGVGAVRVLVGSIGLLLATSMSAVSDTSWRQHRMSIGLAGVGVAGYQVGFFAATDRAGVALGTLVALGSGPVLAGIYHAVRDRRPPGLIWTSATVMAAGGAGLVAFGRDGSDARGLGWGVAAAVLAGSSYALFAIASKRAIDAGLTSLRTMASSFTCGAVILSPLLVVEPMSWSTSGQGIGLALHLGLGATATAYALFGYGLARLTVPTVVTVTMLEPATAAVLSVVVLSQDLDLIGWIGVVIVIAGVCAVVMRPVESGHSETWAE